jgi:hypothetical protein
LTQATVDACIAKVDADEAAWKVELERCEETAATERAARAAQATQAFEACQKRATGQKLVCENNCSSAATRCSMQNADRPKALTACELTREDCENRCHRTAETACVGARAAEALERCESLRPRSVSFEPRRDGCRRPLDALDHLVREAEARVLELEWEALGKKERALAVENLSSSLSSPVIDALVSGHMIVVPAGAAKLSKASSVRAFLLNRTEVTVAAYSACVSAGKCTPAGTGDNCNAGVPSRANHPINCVDWYQAKAYCEVQGLRLPTEEEWEYAANGGDGRDYPWGNGDPSNQLCWDGDGNDEGKGKRHSTCAVGSYPRGRSPFGVDDMSGNVWEWTSSTDDSSGPDRVFRGGAWHFVNGEWDVRSNSRRWDSPSLRFDYLGFRCARSSALP